jgi:hypothetical protein
MNDDDTTPTRRNGGRTTGSSSSSSSSSSDSSGRSSTDNDEHEPQVGAARLQQLPLDDARETSVGAREAPEGRVRPATKRSRPELEGSHDEGAPLEPPRTRGGGSGQRPEAGVGTPRAPPGVAANAPSRGAGDAAGYASGNSNGTAHPNLAALLVAAQERELGRVRERQLALQVSLLSQPPPGANLDLPTQLLLLSSRLQQHQQQQQQQQHQHQQQQPSLPPESYSLVGLHAQGLNAQAQLALLQGYAGTALATTPLMLLSNAQLRGALEQRQREAGMWQQLAERQRGALVSSASSATGTGAGPESSAAAAPFSVAMSMGPLDAATRPSWGSSGLATLTSEEQKEGVGRWWPPAGSSPFRSLDDPSTSGPTPTFAHFSGPPAAQAPPDSGITTKPTAVACRFHPRAINVSLPNDAESTSKFQTLLREQMVYVEAVTLDVQASTQGRNRPIRVGQVGILCRHCRNIPPRNRPRGAIYFPHKLMSIYQSAQNMANHHYNPEAGCPNAPDGVNESLRAARSDKSIVYGGGQQYWARSAVESGLVETVDRGLAFAPNSVTAAAAAGP